MSKFSAEQKWEWLHSDEGPPAEAFEESPTLHYCLEWDGLLVEQGDPEFGACKCFETSVSSWELP